MAPANFCGSMPLAAASLLLTGLLAPAVAENELPDDSKLLASRPRVRVAANNGDETGIRDCLNTAVEAANSETLDGFCLCFAGSSRTRIRKQAAIRFVQYDVAMELLDTQMIKASKTTGEAAGKCRLVRSEDRFVVVSLVALKQENGY